MNATTSGRRAVSIIGTGSYLPEKVLTNAELEKRVDTTDEWIVTRTGMRERHIAREDEATSDMALVAAQRALADAQVPAEEVDLILVATVTPDMIFPSTACIVQHKLGAKRAVCLDLEAACSGFLYAMETAHQYLAGGSMRTALVIGAEKLSCVTDWQDRGTCILFGDGAGAVVMRAMDTGRGILATHMECDGGLTDLLNIPAGGSRCPASEESVRQRLHFMKMSGNEVFKHAVRCMCDAAQKVLTQTGLTVADIRMVIPHQANRRIVEAIATRLGNSLDKFYINLDRVGNISGASVPVALDEAARQGKLKPGDLVLFVVFGGGFTWGASILEWNHGK